MSTFFVQVTVKSQYNVIIHARSLTELAHIVIDRSGPPG